MSGTTRRRFIGTTAIGVAGISLLPSISSCTSNTTSSGESEIMRLGYIGAGVQGLMLLNGFITQPNIRIVAVSEVYDVKANSFKNKVEEIYTANKMDVSVNTYENYEDMLANEDLDVVVCPLPDHQHAIAAIHALNAGCHVYLEKPMTLTVWETQELRKAVERTGKTLQVGSMQRSMSEFIHAVNIVQQGRIGKIHTIYANVNVNGGPSLVYDLPEEPIPDGLNWNLWVGPADINKFHHNTTICPNNESGMQMGSWREYAGLGGGGTTDWGAHNFDIAQWAIGEDGLGKGPVKVEPVDDYQNVKFTYENGVELYSGNDPEERRGIVFYGENGWISVGRGSFESSDQSLYPSEEVSGVNNPSDMMAPHIKNFLDCIESGAEPNASVYKAGCTCNSCNIANIALWTKKSLDWDSVNEVFINDDNEDAMVLLKPYLRDGWILDGALPV